jgi:gas vesicle protein
MDKFSVKSILLGIGIGIIITSVACMIYFQGTPPSAEPNEQEMAKLAEKYGYVRQNATGDFGRIFTDSTAGVSSSTSTSTSK